MAENTVAVVDTAVDLEAGTCGRHLVSKTASGAAQAREHAGGLAKTWASAQAHVQVDDGRVVDDIEGDAKCAGIDPKKAQDVVRNTTRFATAMCIVVAIAKCGVYLETKQAVMKTSALDSVGDLLANAITLYTGYRLRKTDRKRYPVGQTKFESLGCLVFSTLMFALMFSNALQNVESLLESKDEVGTAAISRFFHQAGPGLGHDFSRFAGQVGRDGEGYTWDKRTPGNTFKNPLISFFEEHGDVADKAMVASWTKDGGSENVTMGWLVHEVGEYESDAKKWEELRAQTLTLSCTALYKLGLWLYVILYAIPHSGSNVLRALATDKRNDVIATFGVIVATWVGWWQQDNLKNIITDEKVDPLTSMLLALFIMYTWCQLVVEHLTILSQATANDDLRQGILETVRDALRPSATVADEDVTVYSSSGTLHNVEVCLTFGGDVAGKEIDTTSRDVKKHVLSLEDVERVIVTMQVVDV